MSMTSFCSVRDEDEQRLHALATKTKFNLKELANEMTKRKKDLQRVRLFLIEYEISSTIASPSS